ncbi:MAG: hypothetical protein ACI8YQ_003367 [Polaribacter sp.]|jgi:hypothetical protein
MRLVLTKKNIPPRSIFITKKLHMAHGVTTEGTLEITDAIYSRSPQHKSSKPNHEQKHKKIKNLTNENAFFPTRIH